MFALSLCNSAEIQEKGNGFSASIGAGASVVLIPYFHVKLGYTWVWYWNVSKMGKKTKIVSISGVPNSKVKVTKKSKYVNVYVKKWKNN